MTINVLQNVSIFFLKVCGRKEAIKVNPLVSVIIPCFNCESYVEQAVISIMKQSYRNMEILIADDCSTDNTLAILMKLKKEDNRIHVFRNTQNLKIVKTLNNLIAVAKGKYIARMDADDISDKDRIKFQVCFLEKNTDYALCGTNACFIDKDGTKLYQSNMPITDTENRFFMQYYSTLLHPTILARSEILKNNMYDEAYLYAEDYELWCRLIFEKNYKVYNLPNILFSYRMFSEQSSDVHRKEQWESSAAIFDRYSITDYVYKDIHEEIFYLRNQSLTPDKINYIYLTQKKLIKERMRYAAPVEEKLIYYLHKRHADRYVLQILFSRLGIYTLLHNIYKKYRRMIKKV